MIVIGLSSGTSVDGIDVAVADLRLDGDTIHLTPLGHREAGYPTDLRADVLAALPPAQVTMAEVCRLDTRIGQAFADAARLAQAELCPGGRADLVVSHGQTVYHWVEDGAVRGTLQLGQPAWIAETTGLPVVSDPRARDVAAGGQGAPLASTLDVLWLAGRDAPAAALNLGGIANLTVVAPGRDPVAFDVGPANALLDAAVARATGGRAHLDRDGAGARRGRVHGDLLARLRADPYYARPAPKTTGKELFHAGYLEAALAGRAVSHDDLLATLVALTASTVADACRAYGVTEVVASGGGMRNPALVDALRTALAPARLRTARDLGIDPDAKEAYLFALLGFLTWHGVPATIPSCTGASRATLVGRVSPATGTALPPARLRITGPGDRDPGARDG
ncbi:anhydro-N-acetylmuramic acid kinase [Marinitenerispora sediminis]|uniref:Anhydro-N-acetylmuramic acid kinase n=1 Tax=Marinitenerispora sediminis TaxID=1931232 RepID=A0A368T0G5_9ACTN|nr:anhydro-N-acetylmuramic acid kinase [Marinitenerispora sediminis]RCV50264.1 anhydro-N-acetylmuramic acid kinase [Marinitenerispora sediminis]RCV50473.1 anhydro-N-acetylmuramic acid kinase [Marinitenerispora sediminis]RCV52836.1 anhydro-N-acetylmuramic acid kinase [Marinitenerispora sediminis]